MEIVGAYTRLANYDSICEIPQLFGEEKGKLYHLYSTDPLASSKIMHVWSRSKEEIEYSRSPIKGWEEFPNMQKIQPFTFNLKTQFVILFGMDAFELLEQQGYGIPNGIIPATPFLFGDHKSYTLSVVSRQELLHLKQLPSYKELTT